MKYVDRKNVENFSQICKYEYKKKEKSILRELQEVKSGHNRKRQNDDKISSYPI